jgi:hypothetical protein
MNCEEAKKQLAVYLYGELSFDEEEALEQHLDGCEGCRKDLAAQRRLHEALDQRAEEPPAALLAQCRRELRYAVRDLAPAAAQRTGGLWRKLGGFLAPASGWLKPAGAVALVALGFFSARLTTPTPTGGRTPVVTEPVSMRVRTIEPDASGGIQLVVEETRQRVLRGRLEDEPIRQMLLAASRDPQDPGLRVESVDLLKDRPESVEVRRALLAALEYDPNPGVRLKAIEGLKTFSGDPETRRVLARALLEDDNPGIRTQVIDLLVDKKDPSVVGVLQEALKKEDNNYVRLRSQRALREMNASVEMF